MDTNKEEPPFNLGVTRTTTFVQVSPPTEMQANTLDVMLLCAATGGIDHYTRSGATAVTQGQLVSGGPGGIQRLVRCYNRGPAPGVRKIDEIEIGAHEDARDEDGTVRNVRIVAEAQRVEDPGVESPEGLGPDVDLESEEVEIASSYGDIQSLGSIGDLDVFDLEQGELSDALYDEWITVTRRKPARGGVKIPPKPLEPLTETCHGMSGPVGWIERSFAARKVERKEPPKHVEPARRLIPFGAADPLLTKAQRQGKLLRGTGRWANPKTLSQINGANGECTGTDDLPAHADRFRSSAAEVNRGAGSRSKQTNPASPTEAGAEEARRYEDKQRPCFKFSAGTCRFGEDCKFSHEEGLDPELSKPQGYRGCRDFVKGECRRGDSCRFSHSLGKSGPSEPIAKKPEGEKPPKLSEPRVSHQDWAAGMLREHGRSAESGGGEPVDIYAGLPLLPSWRSWASSRSSSSGSTIPTESSDSTAHSRLTPSSGTYDSESEESSSQDDTTVSSLATDEESASHATLPEAPEVKVGNCFPRSTTLPDLERQFKIFGRLDKTTGTFRITLEEAMTYVMGESELGPLLDEMRRKADFIMKNGGSHKLLAILGTGWMKPGLASLDGPALTPFFQHA